MKNRKIKSLKSRIVITLCTFSLLLTVTLSGLIVMMGTFAQDSIFNIEVKSISEKVYHQYLQGERKFDDIPDKFILSIGTENIPEKIARTLQLDSLDEGIYESQEPIDYHYTITNLPDRDEHLYVLYNVSELERHYSAESTQWLIIIIPAIITTLIGVVVGLLLADKILSPVSLLAARVRNTNKDLQITNLAEGFSEDEIGELARTLESYTNRLADFIVREREFTRNVSHELRTPLAVIKNGSELLRTSTQTLTQDEISVLNRIDRAVVEMEELITTFLLLAREQDFSSHCTTCDVFAHISEIAEKYSYLLNNKSVKYSIVKKHQPVIEVVESFFTIILGNLLRNAFQYTTEGTVEIVIHKQGVEISNHIAHDEEFARGIGHSITSRLCEQLGYRFSFNFSDNRAIAIISW